MTIVAIDPGTTHSAIVHLEYGLPICFRKSDNEDILKEILGMRMEQRAVLALEFIASYGMPVGAEVFQTCLWAGRFIQAFPGQHHIVYRKDVKLNLCGSMRAKDGNVRQAIIDRFGGKEKAIGKKKTPGPLYGVSGDMWAALAVGLTYLDGKK